MKEKLQNLIKNRNTIDFLLIIVLAIILFIPTFNKNLDVYIDDGIQHIARAYGTLEAIRFTEDNFSKKKNIKYVPVYATFCLNV